MQYYCSQETCCFRSYVDGQRCSTGTQIRIHLKSHIENKKNKMLILQRLVLKSRLHMQPAGWKPSNQPTASCVDDSGVSDRGAICTGGNADKHSNAVGVSKHVVSVTSNMHTAPLVCSKSVVARATLSPQYPSDENGFSWMLPGAF